MPNYYTGKVLSLVSEITHPTVDNSSVGIHAFKVGGNSYLAFAKTILKWNPETETFSSVATVVTEYFEDWVTDITGFTTPRSWTAAPKQKAISCIGCRSLIASKPMPGTLLSSLQATSYWTLIDWFGWRLGAKLPFFPSLFLFITQEAGVDCKCLLK